MRKTRTLVGIAFLATVISMIVVNACSDTHGTYETYKINNTKCQRCHKCVPVCGYGAITYVLPSGTDTLGSVKIDPKKCVGCGECFLACPYDAISNNEIRTTSSTSSNSTDVVTGASRTR
jgi:ferredoxin